MVHTIWKKLAGFRQDAHGIVLILTALLILPFIILLGVAVDVGHLFVVKNQLAAAIDAAALSAAKSPSLTDAQAQAQVQAFINANFSSQNQISVSNLTINRANNNTRVDVTATATVNTYFVEVIGYNTLSTTIHSQALAAQNHLEVVLVLDNTGSMSRTYGSSSGIDGLKTAATTLVNTLFDNDPTGAYVKIGVVPFTDTSAPNMPMSPGSITAMPPGRCPGSISMCRQGPGSSPLRAAWLLQRGSHPGPGPAVCVLAQSLTISKKPRHLPAIPPRFSRRSSRPTSPT